MADKDAITLLKEDHDNVRKLLDRLTSTDGEKTRRDTFAKVRMEIMVHARVEEELFYPALSERAESKEDRVMVLEAQEEHNVAEYALEDCEAADITSEDFLACAKVLKELVEHHAEEEENELFPTARDLLKEKRLQQMGREIQSRKKEIQQEIEQQIQKEAQ